MIISRPLTIRLLTGLCGLLLGVLSLNVARADASVSVLSPSPTSWGFGSRDIHGGGLTLQTFTFTNNTASTVNVGTESLVGPDASAFQLSANKCQGAILRSTASCSVAVTFYPTTVGAMSASLELTDSSGTLDVPLAGTGITGTLTATPNNVVFQPQPWFDGGQQTQLISIQNSATAGTQATSLTITGPDASRFYIAAGQNCGSQQYGPGIICGMGVGFNPPNGPGSFHAQLEISSDSLSSPLIIPLNATALNGPIVVLTPPMTDFGQVAIGKSAASTVTVSNYGDSPLQIQGSFMVGSLASFPVTADGCSGENVDPGSSCQLTVSFQPSAVGYRDATLILFTKAQNGRPTTVGFSGTGVPELGGAATVTGTPAAGSTLTCNPVGYPAGTSYRYQWLQNGRPLASAHTPTYVPLDASVGDRLACRVSASNPAAHQTVTSPATARLLPMTLSDLADAFTDQQSCRVLQAHRLLRVGHHTVVIRYGQPVSPLAPLTLTARTPLRVRIDGHTVGHGRSVMLTPRALYKYADGNHTLSVAAAGTSARSQLLLAPCQLAIRLTGGPDQTTTVSASARYGIRALTFHLPRGLRLNANPRQDLGSAAFTSAGYPTRQFTLIGPRTSWDNVNIRLTPHTITITKLPTQTGVINITLRAGVITGQTGNLTATAKERGSHTPQKARTPASWFR